MIQTPVIAASNEHPRIISNVTSPNVVQDVLVEANTTVCDNEPTGFRFMELAVGQSPSRSHNRGYDED